MARGYSSVRWIAMALLLMAPRRAIAAPPDAPPDSAARQAPASDPADKKAEAEAHLDKGSGLYDRGDLGAALAEFLLARRLFPLWKAIYNAGICLEKLQRYDEALDMFEAVLREFGETMPANNKEVAQRKVAKLRELVGTIEVESAEPGAVITIDGRDRGEYPALIPLRVGAGGHVVRVSKAGFGPFEVRVDVAGREVVRIRARLIALTRSGRLGVVEQSGKVLEVVVDGGVVGKTPWDGQLAVGSHVVLLRGKADVGTPPVSVTIELDQTTPLTLLAEKLTVQLRVEPVPVNASVAIDAVTVGRGVWEGRLRAGAHRVEVAAPGFRPSAQDVAIARGEERTLSVRLERDSSSPFWPKPPRRSRFIAEFGTAVALVPTFGGHIADGCTDDCSLSVGIGSYGVLRGGYELGSGFGIGVMAGYLTATQTVIGRQATLLPVGLMPDSGIVNDLLKLRGILVGAWMGWSLFAPVPIHFRLSGGILHGSVEDTRTGKFALGGGGLVVLSREQCLGSTSMGAGDVPCFPVGPVAQRHFTSFFYAVPEVRVGLPLSRHVEVNLGLELPILIGDTVPRWSDDHLINAGSDGAGIFSNYGAPDDPLVGSVVTVFAPSVGARVDF
jgi:hypothetical protein